MEFKRLDAKADFKMWRDLFASSANDFKSFRGFYGQHERIFRGDYLLLKNRLDITRYGLVSYQNRASKLLACVLHFKAKNETLGTRSSLGGFLFDPTLSQEDLKSFALRVVNEAGSIDLAPLNGHINLGLSHPAKGTDPNRVTAFCAPASSQIEIFLRETSAFEICREQYALVTKVDEDLKRKTEAGVREALERGFDSRPLSVLNYKRDIGIYNNLVNTAMKDHPNFYPLTFEEEWDAMKEGLAVFLPSWFRFLTVGGKEIGFCFAVPDYNEGLRSARSDVRNSIEILRQRVRGKWKRARLIYSGIHPDYQGQGLFKAVRHQVINEMIASGVEEFESSYVDEANVKSLANVRSTGGAVSHGFHLFRSRSSMLKIVK